MSGMKLVAGSFSRTEQTGAGQRVPGCSALSNLLLYTYAYKYSTIQIYFEVYIYE